MRSGSSSVDLIADLDEAIGEPVAEAVLVEHRHRDVDVRLELEQPLARVGDRAVADALELDAVARLERLRQRRRSSPQFILNPYGWLG